MASDPSEEPRILGRAEHGLSRKNVHEDALKVLYRLHRSGFAGFLCGGAVRDLLLGRTPKDYDVATDARPQQVRRLFRNSRIIGRRFRLVHVFFKDGNIEVATFRRDPDPQAQASAPGELLITDDNVFGTPREDAFRRDFTINALFYNIGDYTVIDHVGGIADLEARRIRTIGDPDVRFREDPVRMMRACELAGRLGFRIEQRTQEALHRQRMEIEKAAPARLTEELIELLGCGHAGNALHWMMELGLLEVLLPEAYAMVAAGERGLGEFGRLLPLIDERVAAGRELSDTALLAALLLPSVLLRRHDIEALDQRPVRRGAVLEIVREVLEPFQERFALSRLRRERITQAIFGFHRAQRERWSGGRRVQFTRRPSFDDTMLLLELHNGATGEGEDELELWRRAVAAREKPSPAKTRHRRRRRRRRRRKKAD